MESQQCCCTLSKTQSCLQPQSYYGGCTLLHIKLFGYNTANTWIQISLQVEKFSFMSPWSVDMWSHSWMVFGDWIKIIVLYTVQMFLSIWS